MSQVVLPQAPSLWSHFTRLLFFLSLFRFRSLCSNTLSTSHPSSSVPPPHSLLLCSPQSPPKGATIPYRPKPASTPVIFSGGQVRADPLGASTANLSLLLQHQPLPVSVAPGFTHFSPLPHSPPPPHPDEHETITAVYCALTVVHQPTATKQNWEKSLVVSVESCQRRKSDSLPFN